MKDIAFQRWTNAKRVAEGALDVITRSDITTKEMESVIMMSRGDARIARLKELGNAVRARMADQWGSGNRIEGGQDVATLARKTAHCLHSLASDGDMRARKLLPCLVIVWAIEDQLNEISNDIISFTFSQWLEIGKSWDLKREIVVATTEKAEFLRDIARACLMDLNEPEWPSARPTVGREVLIIVQEGYSVLLPRLAWHVVDLTSVRRTRCSGRLKVRLQREGDWGGRVGQELDYPMSMIVGQRQAEE